MKKIYLTVVGLIMALCISTSCTDYLDVSPEAGLSEEEVFGKYVNMKSFFDVVYGGKNRREIITAYPLNLTMWDQKSSMNATTDIADNGRIMWGQPVKMGTMMNGITSLTYNDAWGKRPVFDAMFKSIRVANITLKNLHRVEDAPTPEDIDDIRGQAYFVRAFCHFILACYWGPMPHLTQPIGPYDDWDIPRLGKHETFMAVANDLDSAYVAFQAAGKIRRDPGPGQAGHLEDPLQERPAGMAAKALKSRVLLYAASKLNNANGVDDWKLAADAAWEAIQLAEQNQYTLMPMDKYYENFHTSKYSNEQIWAWHAGKMKYNASQLQTIISGIFMNDRNYSSGENPTQNMVDMYETKWGDALNTEEDRKVAEELGHYDEQNPYVDRDPRFYNNIIYNMADITWSTVKTGEYKNKANIYYTKDANGQNVYATHYDPGYKGHTYTGYYVRKCTDDLSYRNQMSGGILMTDPLIRLAELYLNYAEAVNEAYGPQGTAPGSNLTAADALNVIRNRAGLPDLADKYLGSSDSFRERVYNERTVEFDQEGNHRFHDIRRWMIAPEVMTKPLYGMDIEKTGDMQFKYTRVELPSDRQPKWFDYMYYFPLDPNDYYKFKDFDTSLNPVW